MYIILDTNIIQKSWNFESFEHRALLDFVERTDSIILMPEIIWDEIAGQYLEKLKPLVQSLNGTADNIERFFPSESGITIPHFNYQHLVADYQEFLKRTLRLDNTILMFDTFIPYPENALGEIAKRGIARKKPFNLKGEEFRDAIIWFTILKYLEKNPYTSLAFISSNLNEFSDMPANSSILHPDLQSDVREYLDEGTFKYYSSLKSFLDENYEPVKHLTLEWIQANVDYQEIDNAVLFALMVQKTNFKERVAELEKYPFSVPEMFAGRFEISRAGIRVFRSHLYSFLHGTYWLNISVAIDIVFTGYTADDLYMTTIPVTAQVSYTLENEELFLKEVSGIYVSKPSVKILPVS